MDVALLGEIKELLSVYGGYKEYTTGLYHLLRRRGCGQNDTHIKNRYR